MDGFAVALEWFFAVMDGFAVALEWFFAVTGIIGIISLIRSRYQHSPLVRAEMRQMEIDVNERQIRLIMQERLNRVQVGPPNTYVQDLSALRQHVPTQEYLAHQARGMQNAYGTGFGGAAAWKGDGPDPRHKPAEKPFDETSAMLQSLKKEMRATPREEELPTITRLCEASRREYANGGL